MVYTFRPRGVCSQEMRVEVDEAGVIRDLQVLGGCSGNLQGISALVQGMPAQEAIQRLKGSAAASSPPPARISWPRAWRRCWNSSDLWMAGPPVPRVPPGKKAADIPLPVHEKPPPDGGGFFLLLGSLYHGRLLPHRMEQTGHPVPGGSRVGQGGVNDGVFRPGAAGAFDPV